MKKSGTIAVSMLAGAPIGAAIQGLHAQTKPPAFLIFEAEITDRAAYEPFRQTAVREIERNGGKYLAVGATPQGLTGNPPPRVTLSQWPSKDDVIRWFNSEPMKPVWEAQTKYTKNTRVYVFEGRAP